MAKEKLKEGWVEKKAPKHVLFIFCFAYVLALALGWLPQTPSQEELYGSGGRFLGEVVQNFMVARGIPWWSSHFMQGYSTANFALCGVPLLMGIIARSIFGDPFGIKVAALMILPLAAFTMFLFVRRLTRNEWTGVVAAILYVTSSQMLLRIGNFEHWMGSYSYIFPPLIFWAFLKISENGSWQSIAWLAFGGACMMLSYSKLTFMFIPLAMAFYTWLLIDRPKQRSILIRGTLLALAGVILMAVIVLLPLTREFRWVAAFSFDNFLGWQRAFSFKNFISVLDRGNALLANMRADFLADRGQFYLGAIVLLSVVSVFWWSRRNSAWLATRQGGL